MSKQELKLFVILILHGIFQESSSTHAIYIQYGGNDGNALTPSQPTCNAPPDPSVPHYIVAYGSLIETASKDRTQNNTGESIPVLIHGYSREWNLRGETLGPSTTYLGVLPQSDCTFNGVIFQLPPSDVIGAIQGFDQRERFYCRTQVNPNDIQVLNTNPGHINRPTGQYWIYINRPEFTAPPTKQYPIVESYVDIFISGCLEVEDRFGLVDFARKCVNSTKGWSEDNWVNDRIYPRRPFIYQPRSSRIDMVLNDRVPRAFHNIRAEGFGYNHLN